MVRRILTAVLTAVLIAVALASATAAVPGLLENVAVACDRGSGAGC